MAKTDGVKLTVMNGLCSRVMETCFYACRSCSTSRHEEKAKFYRHMVLEDIDSMLLRLFEAFLEAAPQLVLQLYICTQIGMEEGVGLGESLKSRDF